MTPSCDEPWRGRQGEPQVDGGWSAKPELRQGTRVTAGGGGQRCRPREFKVPKPWPSLTLQVHISQPSQSLLSKCKVPAAATPPPLDYQCTALLPLLLHNSHFIATLHWFPTPTGFPAVSSTPLPAHSSTQPPALICALQQPRCVKVTTTSGPDIEETWPSSQILSCKTVDQGLHSGNSQDTRDAVDRGMSNACTTSEMEFPIRLAPTIVPLSNTCCLAMSTLASVQPHSQDNTSRLKQVWAFSSCPREIMPLYNQITYCCPMTFGM
ncbi:uncharacterized protein LOC118810656 [Colossoma macropomum]|uniref:uncharacterized protein LOC118810656 n=1 Tax=Colossoma macropomum TaxID=42526 RepID=UPI001863E688|nr:uncharacterized protein LOC118810656 [Colossoma macropomum]